jgi:aryl-alcohol dehydrogenase-like predicted oxidoreductase
VPRWLDPSELRVGLGCMRLSTDEGRDEERALETIAAAAEAGVTVFDTARAYGDNESLVVRGLRRARKSDTARIVTKGGMARSEGRWIPDGRARTIRSDCEASLAALDGLPVDLYLVHAPDPRRPWKTTLRALARLADEGLVRHVGVANVNRTQLDEALELAPVVAVQAALSPFDDGALRGGVVDRCAEREIAVLAHSPLGGPKRAGSLARKEALAEIAHAHGATPAEIAIAWLLGLGDHVVAIPGARRPETARSAARAVSIQLTDAERKRIRRPPGRVSRAKRRGEVVLVMGIPGAGKSRVAEEYAARGYVRLNRDERGGSLRDLAVALDEELPAGRRQVVLDNTYLTRAARSYVVEAAGRHGLAVRCIWLDTPLAQAQVNMVERLLERFGALPTPDELKELARREPGLLAPTSQMRAARELEPPTADEGFSDVDVIPFTRSPSTGRGGVFVAATALATPGWADDTDPAAPHLIFDWSPEGARPIEIPPAIARPAEVAVCVHPGGPPTCWCRPPLPGLALAFARTHGVDPSRSVLIGTGPAHKTLAATLGARYVAVS